ncbi:MAG: hypothetical protein HOI89_10715 [Phycisphaerae bacterium]|nr:hypothetical protein [Phycisphaerae bacterium]
MSVRILVVIAFMMGGLASSAAKAAQLPGLRPSDLGRLAFDRSDIRTLNVAVPLEAADLQRAYEIMKTYERAVQEGSRDVVAAIASLDPPALASAKDLERSQEQMVDSVRDRIEARRRAGEFRDDPAGLREAWQEAMDEAERELKQARRDSAQADGWNEAFRKQAIVLAVWYETRAELKAQLRSDLEALIGSDRMDQLADWWQHTRLSSSIARARLSGEGYDPFSHVPDASDAVGLFRAEWEAAHIILLDARDAAIRRVPLVAADAIARGDLQSLRNARTDSMAAREAVREHALAGAETVAVLLDDEAAAAYVKAASRKAFPAAWRRDRAARAIASAWALSSLDEAQRVSLAALRLEHEQLAADLREEHIQAVRAEEGGLLLSQDMQRSLVLFDGDEFTPQGVPGLDGSKQERRALSVDTMSRLQSVLTESQWKGIPGTRTQPDRD